MKRLSKGLSEFRAEFATTTTTYNNTGMRKWMISRCMLLTGPKNATKLSRCMFLTQTLVLPTEKPQKHPKILLGACWSRDPGLVSAPGHTHTHTPSPTYLFPVDFPIFVEVKFSLRILNIHCGYSDVYSVIQMCTVCFRCALGIVDNNWTIA